MASKTSLSNRMQTKLKAAGFGSDTDQFKNFCDALADAIHEEYKQGNTQVIIPSGEVNLTGYIS